MVNEFKIGDRVRCVEGYGDGAVPGDTGTVIGYDSFGTVYVKWDDYRDCRHDCWGRCEEHYGWNVPYSHLEYDVCENDFGELPALNVMDVLC